ncbi:hypothetical protein MEN41_04430 [Dolichospermum sp. ST_con]|nr:hypothetical protein [Dolichospermum sp. ST_con]MDD1419184.1 hypothetical protein [Dolichospermum sp. ST_sed1]MDD1425700.1 hypothetical protein [Dolichospermum sp. ST_sed9]MDD1432641.1 hypothetical protein [Dolichospermum sp. ST_sed6]MDD1434888.1 hypothetical protein [Dolichospermum sp. ST_sed10]MDD1441264.1 hypothetical protein [Dolichospermum sp. ST_sed3]MDD1447100.1 hypothetical protein [Dolichospermum sp. ST_sed8]MDD1454784.1 hypothetical protein [Dolichospermum sp. ST_sed7]MDD145953
MARAIERIEKEINELKVAISAIAQELNSAYARYINTLGPALQKQLILASYYLCTQGYPEEFLNLSLNQRQKLQQGIRKLSKEAFQQLISYIQPSEVTQTETVVEFEKEENTEIENGEKEENEQQPKVLDPSNPIELVEWQQNLEEAIQETLKKLSQVVNILIQKNGVLPKKLPEPILVAATAAAASSESSSNMIPSPPNLLNLVIEISNDEDSEDSSLTQIMAIHLRLGEIEFAEATLLAERKGIRNILMQLNKLGREYQKRQRELKIAEAEAAWRASWFED